MRKLLPFMVLLALALHLSAQLSLDGQIRPRAEFRQGYRQLPSPGSDPALQINQRTRLSLGYQHEGNISTRVSIQDVRIWGQDLQMTHRPSFDLYEAWVGLTLRENLIIKAGRQELKYDNQRLLAINDWALTGRTHDALVIQYITPLGCDLHLGGAFNQSQNKNFGTAYPLNNYKTLGYLWYRNQLSSELSLSLLAITDGFEDEDDPKTLHSRGTWSGFFEYTPSGFLIRFNPAYQHGKTRTGQDISAHYLMLEVAGDLGPNMHSMLGAEWVSGNDGLNPGEKFRAFDDLYGVGHGRNGSMDYFTNFPRHTLGAGLINPYLKNTFSLSEKSTLSADIHGFLLQNNLPGPTRPEQPVEAYLGTELDLLLTHRFNAFTQVLFGYSIMMGTESMEAIKGGSKDEFAHWGFVMIRMSPTFLSLQ